MRIRIWLVGVLSFYFIALSAQDDIFTKANNAYNSADYSGAISLYQQLLDEGLESPDLYLNLGNSYLNESNLGKAIWSYEKGLKLDTDHSALDQNLQYANKQIKTQITPIPDFFLSRYWSNLVSVFGSTAWAVIQLLLLVLIAIALGYWLLSKELKIKKTAFYSLLFLGFLFLISMLAGIARTNQLKSSTEAIVTSKSTRLLSSASDQSELLFDLSEGNKVKIIDVIGDFYKVQLIDKEIGWMDKKDLEEI